MAPIARADIFRIVLTGSESTGKTTLAAALAAQLGVPCVPEFVRAFAERKGAPVEFSDHGEIARGQMALEDLHAARLAPGGVLVQDTDLLSTVVYCRHYFGDAPGWMVQAARQRRPSLYLLCDIDLPWVPDGVRDRGDRRAEVQRLFAEAAAASGARVLPVRGAGEERLASAMAAVAAVGASGASGASGARGASGGVDAAPE
jgi:nicotinamide riboside kinase